jgi:glycosyltransferase involved in cell wall biosynthesis
VLQVVLSLNPGGTERLVIDLVHHLRAHAVESVVCCLEEAGSWASQLTSAGVRVVSLQRRAGFSPDVARRLARVMVEHGIHVVHAHHYSPFVYAQLGALRAGNRRVVFTEHGRLSDAPPSTKRQIVNPLLGRLPAAIFAVSHDLRRYMIDEGLPCDRVRVLHNGISPEPLPTEAVRSQARSALELDPSRIVVGTVARLDPVKDLGTLIEAFGLLHRRSADTHLVIVGDGTERASLADKIAALGLNAAVTLTGHHESPRMLLPGFDVYVNSSVHEGLSVTILEAMSAALPVVATHVGGNPELVSADTGSIVPPRDPAAMGQVLNELAADRSLRKAYGAAGRARVESCFTFEQMALAYLQSYRAAGPPVQVAATPACASS